MSKMRCVVMVLMLALFLTALGVPPVAAAPVRREVPGTITGRVRPAAALVVGRLAFVVDGAPARPKVVRDSFTLKDIPPGEHTLSLVDARGQSGAHLNVAVRSRAVTNVGVVTLIQGGQITGLVSKVIGPETGELEPLAGVEVVAEIEQGPQPLRAGIQGAEHMTAVTDEHGAYAFRGVPAGYFRVSVVVPGLEAGVAFVEVQPGQTADADFQLFEAIEEGVGTVTGTVRSSAGQPIEGALVTIYLSDIYFPTAVAEPSLVEAAQLGRLGQAIPPDIFRGEFSTLTDAGGRFTLNVPSGRLFLSVYADGFIPVSVPLVLHPRETLTQELVLDPEVPPAFGVVEGTVVDAVTMRPIAGAQVMLDIMTIMGPVGAQTSFAPPAGPVTTTDRQGRYRLEGILVGPWGIIAAAKNYEAQTLETEVVKDKTVRLNFTLKRQPPPRRG